MLERWLAPSLTEAAFSRVVVHASEPVPSASDFDGYLITESKYGVYEQLSWLPSLCELVRSAAMREKPVFGVCFGHQVIALAHGATVRKSHTGWAMGVQDLAFVEESDSTSGPYFVFHQDQVESVPDNARVIGSTNQCPIAALSYDFPALSVQYHPEFTDDYMRLLVELKSTELPAESIDTATNSLNEKIVENGSTSLWVAGFFRQFSPLGS